MGSAYTYSNPSKEQFNVSLLLNEEESASIIVYDLTGKEILNSRLNSGVNEIETSELKSSIYYYHVLVNGEVKKSDKLIIL